MQIEVEILLLNVYLIPVINVLIIYLPLNWYMYVDHEVAVF